MNIQECLIPQFNQRKKPITMLVLHSYANEDFPDSCARNEVSAHYVIDQTGRITRFVKEEDRAWHAGKGYWRGMDNDINSASIGIEVWNRTLGQSPFPQKQINTLIKLCQDIVSRHNIKPENIVGHSDIAPDRKPDPGHFFPWQTLAAHNLGLWYDIKNANKLTFPLMGKEELSEAKRGYNSGRGAYSIPDLLTLIGYNPETPQASAYAFCRRFLPEYIKEDLDIPHLVNHVLPADFAFMQKEKFLKTLKSVAYEYNVISSEAPQARRREILQY